MVLNNKGQHMKFFLVGLTIKFLLKKVKMYILKKK